MYVVRILAGSTSVDIPVPVFDSSSAVGAKLAGLVYNSSGLSAYYSRQGVSGAAVAISLATKTKGTWATGGFVAMDGTNMPGDYELGVPDAALAAGAKWVKIQLKGATNMVPVDILVIIDDTDFTTSQKASLLTGSDMEALALNLNVAYDAAKTAGIRKNTALAKFMFQMRDSTTHLPKTGLSPTCTRSIDGGAFAAGTITNIAEISSGWYRCDFGAADLNGKVIALRAAAAGSDDTDVTIVTED